MRSLFFISILFLSFKSFSQETITSSQAKDFVGKEVFLTGKVAGTKKVIGKSEKPVLFLNIDKEYPENEIVVVIFSDVLSQLKFTEVDLREKTIKVKGKVGIFKEKPQIILENEASLVIEQ